MNPKERAKQAAEYLFTNGAGEKSVRLALIDADGRDLGGWGFDSVLGVIERQIEEANARAEAADRDIEALRGLIANKDEISYQSYLAAKADCEEANREREIERSMKEQFIGLSEKLGETIESLCESKSRLRAQRRTGDCLNCGRSLPLDGDCWGCAVDMAWADIARLRTALMEIRDGRFPQVCAEFEACKHEGCAASYAAYEIARQALAPEAGEGGKE